MSSQRGFTLVELMVASAIGVIVLLGSMSMYLATTRAFAQSSSQVVLQRQGTLAVQQIAQQLRRASTLGTACAPAGTTGRSLLVTINNTVPASLADAGTYCYYAGSGTNGAAAGALCERFTPVGGVAGSCRDLLAGPQAALVRQTGQTGISLVRQPTPADPGCPRHSDAPATAIPGGQYCLAVTLAAADTADAGFAITDGLNGMTFNISLMLRN